MIGARFLPAALLALSLMACSGAQRSGESHEAVMSDASPEPLPPTVPLSGGLSRSTLQQVLGRSVGDVLRRVEVEAETRDGAFVGWRLVALPDTMPDWFDLRAGDVVTSINGLPLQRPEEAQQVWELLQVSSEVRVDFLRDGEREALRLPVEEDVSPEPPAPEGDSSPSTAPEPRRGPEE